MARKTERKVFGAYTYRIKQFGAKQNTLVFARLRNMGAFLGLPLFIAGQIKVPPDDMLAMAEELLSCVELVEKVIEGKEIYTPIAAEWDEHFAGENFAPFLRDLLPFIVEFNFGGFLAVGTLSPASPKSQAPSPPPSSVESTG
jgi:hypothetical protein